MMDHVEEQCSKFQGRQDDNYAKPYGRWFQNDVLGKEYRKPAGKRFGLEPDGGWTMKVPVMDDIMENDGVEIETGGGNRNDEHANT